MNAKIIFLDLYLHKILDEMLKSTCVRFVDLIKCRFAPRYLINLSIELYARVITLIAAKFKVQDYKQTLLFS